MTRKENGSSRGPPERAGTPSTNFCDPAFFKMRGCFTGQKALQLVNYIACSQQNYQCTESSVGTEVSRCRPDRRKVLIRKRFVKSSVALARFGREVLLELAILALVLVGVGWRFLVGRDVGPFRGVFRVELKPLLQPALGIGQDRFGRAFRFAHAAIDAFAGVDNQHVLALIEAIYRANLDAIHIFAFDAGVGNNKSHGQACLGVAMWLHQ